MDEVTVRSDTTIELMGFFLMSMEATRRDGMDMTSIHVSYELGESIGGVWVDEVQGVLSAAEFMEYANSYVARNREALVLLKADIARQAVRRR